MSGSVKAFVWILLLCLVPSCSKPPERETLRVAMSVPATTSFGQAFLQGARLALEEANETAGRFQVELCIFDTMPQPMRADLAKALEMKAAQAAVEDPMVVAYLGPASSRQARTSMPLLNEAGLTQVSPSATWPGLTRPGFGPGEPAMYFPSGKPHFFRVAPTDSVQAAAAARWAHRLGVTSAFLIDDGVAHARGSSGIFEETARDLGIEITGRYRMTGRSLADQGDIPKLVAEILEADPDLVHVASLAGAGLIEIVRQLRIADPDILLLGIDSFLSVGLLSSLDEPLTEGLMATSFSMPVAHMGTARAEIFLQNYRDRYGTEPLPESACAYEALKAILAAIAKSPTGTREEVLEAMTNLGEISGLLGKWHFDEFGDTSLSTVGGFRVRNGSWVFEERLY